VLRITIDTNVLISALVFPSGKPFQLLEMAREGKVLLGISAPILAEVEDVLGGNSDGPRPRSRTAGGGSR
jgi:putative PIN family toxin of toxin-antitoxin system